MQSSPADYLAQALGGGGLALSYGQMTKGVVREHLLELALVRRRALNIRENPLE